MMTIDIETVPRELWEDLPERQKNWWRKQAHKHEIDGEGYYEKKAALYPEFGKIICISYFLAGNVDTFIGEVESELLTSFFQKVIGSKTKVLAGHNIKEFDIPYVCKRALVHKIMIPAPLDMTGKKPWEVPHVDTMELLRYGSGYQNKVSMDNTCFMLGIDSPKKDVDGAMVGDLYKQRDYSAIKEYCEKDVIAVTQILERMKEIKMTRQYELL